MSSIFPSPFNQSLWFNTNPTIDGFRSLQAVDRHAAEKMTDAAKEGMEQVRPKIKEAIWWDPVDEDQIYLGFRTEVWKHHRFPIWAW